MSSKTQVASSAPAPPLRLATVTVAVPERTRSSKPFSSRAKLSISAVLACSKLLRRT